MLPASMFDGFLYGCSWVVEGGSTLAIFAVAIVCKSHDPNKTSYPTETTTQQPTFPTEFRAGISGAIVAIISIIVYLSFSFPIALETCLETVVLETQIRPTWLCALGRRAAKLALSQPPAGIQAISISSTFLHSWIIRVVMFTRTRPG
jgi:hypothetical protein